MTNNYKNNNWPLVPVYGIILFIILYIVAASLYPGGSDVDKASKGFSWLHNYWCELMAPTSQNGEANTARPVAITAMTILAISLGFFWYNAGHLFKKKSAGRLLIRYAGILSVVIWLFFLADVHDPVINLSGLCGIIALITVMIALYKKDSYILFFTGLLCLLLCGLNNYIYHTTTFVYYLPIIQKISFIVFLLWFCAVSIKLNSLRFHGM